jgi:cell division protein FtsB
VRARGGQVIAAVLAFAIAGVAWSALLGEHGVRHLLDLRAERQDLGRSAFRLLQENAQLRDQIVRLKTDDLYLEDLARKQLGLVKPNETVYRYRSSRGDEPGSSPRRQK